MTSATLNLIREFGGVKESKGAAVEITFALPWDSESQ